MKKILILIISLLIIILPSSVFAQGIKEKYNDKGELCGSSYFNKFHFVTNKNTDGEIIRGGMYLLYVDSNTDSPFDSDIYLRSFKTIISSPTGFDFVYFDSNGNELFNKHFSSISDLKNYNEDIDLNIDSIDIFRVQTVITDKDYEKYLVNYSAITPVSNQNIGVSNTNKFNIIDKFAFNDSAKLIPVSEFETIIKVKQLEAPVGFYLNENDFTINKITSFFSINNDDTCYIEYISLDSDLVIVNNKIETNTDNKGTINYSVNNGKIKFTVTPKDGYILDKVIVKDKNGNVIEFKNYEFELDDRDIFIEATFIEGVVVPNTGLSVSNFIYYIGMGILIVGFVFMYIIRVNSVSESIITSRID